MRGFLIFLAFAAPLVLLNPVFWWLVQSEVGAAPSIIVEADGATRETFIGPRSPWPDWPRLPEGGGLTPAAFYGSAPGHPAQGFGDVTLATGPQQAIGPLLQRLEREGWSVSAVRYRLAEPSIPPQWISVCTITAHRVHDGGQLTAMYGFQLAPASHTISVHWIEGPPLATWPNPETLPEWSEPHTGC